MWCAPLWYLLFLRLLLPVRGASFPEADAIDVDELEAHAAGFELLQKRHKLSDGPADGQQKTFPETPRTYDDLVPPGLVHYKPEYLLQDKPETIMLRHVHHSAWMCNYPIFVWLNETFPDPEIASKIEILDVGGGDRRFEKLADTFNHKKYKWTCLDVTPENGCNAYPGDRLRFPANSADIVMFVDMFHHVIDGVFDLLQDAAQIARQYVVVQDVLHGDTYGEVLGNLDHEWHGVYRTEYEWERIFEMFDFRIVFKQRPEYDCGLWFPAVHMVWVLAPKEKP